jgi:hypothetical protein
MSSNSSTAGSVPEIFYSQEILIGFALNLAGASISIAGCIVTHYLVKTFGSILSYSLLVMNIGTALNLLFTALSWLNIGDTQGVFQFMSWVFGMIGIEAFMIQIMYRMYLLPGSDHRIPNIIQWIIFIGASANYLVNVICEIPTSLADTSLGCYSNNLLASMGFLILALDILNSIYVIHQVTTKKYYLAQDHESREYLGFMARRLPVLVLNMIIGVTIIIFVIVGYQNSYDAVDYGIAVIIFISQFYYFDFKEFALANRATSNHNSGNHSDHRQSSDRQLRRVPLSATSSGTDKDLRRESRPVELTSFTDNDHVVLDMNGEIKVVKGAVASTDSF